MAEDTKKTDPKRISLDQHHEIDDWMKSLGCTEELLREAVQAVGHSADEVRLYLAGRCANMTPGRGTGTS
jgi:hypothetical protein